MKKEAKLTIGHIISGIIVYYLCGCFIPFFGNIMVKYPFQTFVTLALVVIMGFLAFLTVRLKRGH